MSGAVKQYAKCVDRLEQQMVVVDWGWRYLLGNRASLTYSALEREQLIGHSAADLLNPGVCESAVKQAEFERTRLQRHMHHAQEQERRRIAREMHDQFGQQLTALNLKIAALRREYASQQELAVQLQDLEDIARELDRDIDFLVWELRPTALDDVGLRAALTDHVKRWSEHFGIEAELVASGIDGHPLPTEVDTVLYRATQEALTNIAKHSGAEHASVILEHRNGHVSLIIEDDGQGCDPEQALAFQNGLGLPGLRERATLVGGTLAVESAPGRGTTVVIRIPVEHSDVREPEHA